MGVRGQSKYLGYRCNKLTVEEVTYRPQDRQQLAICRCECGRVVEVNMRSIRDQARIACGSCIAPGGSARTYFEPMKEALARIRAKKEAAEARAIALMPPYRRPFDDLAIWRGAWMQ